MRRRGNRTKPAVVPLAELDSDDLASPEARYRPGRGAPAAPAVGAGEDSGTGGRPALRLASSEDGELLELDHHQDPDLGLKPEPAAVPPDTAPRGTLVEFVRLVIVSLFAVAGWEVAALTGRAESELHLVYIIVGTGIGYVLGGAFGRRAASAISVFEREFRRAPAAEILAAGIGLILGLVVAALLSFPLYHLPPRAGYPAVVFIYVALAFLGSSVGRAKSEELFGLFGVKPRAAGTRPLEVAVLDSSAILDGRIVALIRMGFLGGTLLVTRGVIHELQTVADSSNPSRRARGRRGLDSLVAMRRDPAVDIALVDEGWTAPGEPVDVQLVRLARARGGSLVTNDSGLAKVAAALDVPVRSIHALAEALRPEVVAGEQVSVRLSRRGRESGQAVGYLDDGTMVVVEEADHLLGNTVGVTVTNALQTSTGRLIFARVTGDPEPES